ncbi:S9 family peptidase [Sphingomonas oryzagri]
MLKLFNPGIALILGLMSINAAMAQTPVASPAQDMTGPETVIVETRAAPARVSPTTLYFSRGVSDAVWTPDGRAVVMSTNLSGRYNIWRAPVGGGWPQQLSQSEERQIGLTVTPDGKTVIFESDHGGDENWRLYSVPVAGGPTVEITKGADVWQSGARVSPDGRSLAFAQRVKGVAANNIAIMDVESGSVRTLTNETDPVYIWSVVAWSSDGRTLVANRTHGGYTSAAVWTFDTGSGQGKRLTPDQFGQVTIASDISPDGKLIAATSAIAGVVNGGVLNLATGAWRAILASPWQQFSGHFSPDGRRLIVTTNKDGRGEISLVALDGSGAISNDLPKGVDAEASLYQTSFARDGRLLVTHHAANTPPDLWIVQGAKASQLTQLSMANVGPATLPASQIIHYAASDGTIISAQLRMPFNLPKNGRAPAIVLAHGGPNGQSKDEFDEIAAALVTSGYVVIAPNVRGSSGYGMQFMTAEIKDLGGADLDDEVQAAAFLVRTGYVDPKRIGITGGSYGGFMTLMAVGRTPNVWAAGVSRYGIVDWRTLTPTPALSAFVRSLLGDPVTDSAIYERSSPMTYLAAAKAPLLILQGDNDVRVTRAQASQAVTLLRDAGGTVDAHFYPDEGHGFVKRENQIDALDRTIAWFDRYLKK